MTTDTSFENFFKDLKALAESAFPKNCANCGRVYETAEQFMAETENINPERSGLKSSVDDDGTPIVEAFRNCVCGSTLMDFFSSRRDLSEKGLARRKKFGEMLDYLESQGLEFEIARVELIKVLRGENSEILKNFKPPSSSK